MIAESGPEYNYNTNGASANGTTTSSAHVPPHLAAYLEAAETRFILEALETLDDALHRTAHHALIVEGLDTLWQQLYPVVPTAQADLPLGDAANALALLRRHAHEMRFCAQWKAWVLWTGTHWARDMHDLVIRWMRDVVCDMQKAIPSLEADDEEEKVQALRKHIKASLQTRALKNAIDQAPSFPGIKITTDLFDRDLWLLNCANGTLDLRTGMLREHVQDDMLTKCLAIEYDPTATCPTWEQFLKRIMGWSQGDDDPDTMSAADLERRQEADARAQSLIDFHQRFLGYTLTGDTREQCFCLLHGTGANGKSTYLETVRVLLGEYALSTPSASLLAKERNDGIPNDIARLRGARLVTAVEMGEGRRLNEELVKRLTGQDIVTARFLNEEFFDFKPEFKLMAACNHLPKVNPNDYALWRRIHCLPFTVTIPEQEQDRMLTEKLQTELPGILAWAVRGCLDWQQGGLRVPDAVRRATEEYRVDMDSLGRFLEECCLRLPEARVKAGDLYDAYKTWCAATGEYTLSMTAIGKQLEERGFLKHTSNYVWRLGLALKDHNA